MRKWLRTIIIWLVLFIPISAFNVVAYPILAKDSVTQYSDPKALHYNFTMSQPAYASGEFSVGFPLQRPNGLYQIFAHVAVSENFSSKGAYGSFSLTVNISENGVFVLNHGNVESNILPPPVPPNGYGLAVHGPLPFNGTQEPNSHLVQGGNVVSLNFTFLSKIENYGPGYYVLDIGPFIVEITNLSVSYFLEPLALAIIAVILVPVAHGLGLWATKVKRRRKVSAE